MKPDITDLSAELQRLLDAATERAYQSGYKAGGEDMRNGILAAAQGAPITPNTATSAYPVRHDIPAPVKTRAIRAPKGLIDYVIGVVLSETPGLSIKELEQRVHGRDPRVAIKSVYNRLRLMEGKLYRRAENSWFLMGPETSSAEQPRLGYSAEDFE